MASTSSSGSKGKEKLEVYPFREIVPSPPPGVPNATKKVSYDVFINHCGQDVKTTLASVLHGLLTDEQLSVFLDKEELEYGGYFLQALVAAMNNALVHIALFFKNYAESSWCLAELTHMLRSHAPIIPIFYKVDPSDLRYVKGKYGEALRKYQEKHRYLETLDEWKTTLKVISGYNGEVITDVMDESRQLKHIVDTILKIKKQKEPLKVADHPVGMEDIVKKFETKTNQSVEGDESVSVIGIWGMGDLGKTTLAKEIYNRKSSLFNQYSFVYNVRDGGLVEKQKKILKDSSFEEIFDNIEEGKEKISSCLRSIKVLMVFDDVDRVDQLDALLPAKDRLANGSLIIVTTRERNVLVFGNMIICIYKMEALDLLYARELFCWYAFENMFPWDGFEELVEKFVKGCHGLLLSLKVTGREFYRESNKNCWESLLFKIWKILPKNIQKTLQISYDTFDDKKKEMFLDASCFFIREKSSLVIELWNGLEWSGYIGLKKLVSKYLVELDEDNFISIHDHIRDMGRNIAEEKSPYHIWLPQPVINVQNQKEKGIGILGIMATPYQIRWTNREHVPKMCGENNEAEDSKIWCSHTKLMVKTTNGIWSLSPSLVGLKFLVIIGDSFTQIMGQVSKDLIWLRWFEIGQRNLSSELSLKNLRVLELHEQYFKNHCEELWGDGDAPVQLRVLFISGCDKFQGFPKSIGLLSHLRKIVIIYGSNIKSLPDEFCLLRSLEHLTLPGSRIQSLPINFGNLSSLQRLDLSLSSELRSLPGSFKSLTRLKHLNLLYCSQLTFTPEDLNYLQNIRKLKYLNPYHCNPSKELRRHIGDNVSIRELDLRYTSLRELPENIGKLSWLTRMDIGNVWSTNFPISLESLSEFTIDGSADLKCLPGSLGSLRSLAFLSLEYLPQLESLPGSLGSLSSMTKLRIFNCAKLEHLPESLGDLFSLTNLDIVNCPKLDHLGERSLARAIRQLSSLQSLRISNCPISSSSLTFGSSSLHSIYVSETEVSRISISEDRSPNLKRLDVKENHHLEEIEGLPSTLEIIYMGNCEMLRKMSGFARLTSLRMFHLSGWNCLEKIEGLENCTALRELIVETRMEIPGIESLEHLQNLGKLQLSANRGPAIARCIQRMHEWPREPKIWARALAVPDAASLVESFLSQNLEIVHSISNQKIQSIPTLVQKRSSNGKVVMICFVINCVSSQTTLEVSRRTRSSCSWFGEAKYEEGRWAWVGVFRYTQHSCNLLGSDAEYCIYSTGDRGEENDVECQEGGEMEARERGVEDEVERGLVVMGEEGTLMDAFRSLLPLLFQS